MPNTMADCLSFNARHNIYIITDKLIVTKLYNAESNPLLKVHIVLEIINIRNDCVTKVLLQ